MAVFGISPLPIHLLRTRFDAGLRIERFRVIALETGDPYDPTSPRREASLFDSPGLLGRGLFSADRTPICGTRPMGRSDAGGSSILIFRQLMWQTPHTTCIFRDNQDDVFRGSPRHSPPGFAQDPAPGRFGARATLDRIACQAFARHDTL